MRAIWAKATQIPASLIAKTAPYVFDKDLAIDMKDLARQEAFAVASGRIGAAPPADTLVDARLAATR